MSDKNSDLEFTRTTKNVFDRSVADIDAATLSELQQRRQIVLEDSARKNLNWIYYPAGAMVAACLAVVIYTFTSTSTTHSVSPDDLDMLSRTESLEFYENLEFYEWLEEYDLST